MTARPGNGTDWEARARTTSQQLADSRRKVEHLEMQLRLAQAREEKALHRARLAEINSKRWHALLLRNKIEALP